LELLMMLGRLIEVLFELGAPISLPAADELLCADLQQLQDVGPHRRLRCLQKAKDEALRQYLADCIDQISAAAECDDGSAAMLLGGFIADDFTGRDEQSTPRAHATLVQYFYGKPLSHGQIRNWTRLARAAAKAPNAEDRASAKPVVYLISTGDPTMVKIGYSAHLSHRLRALRTASPVEPHIHLILDGDKRLEVELRQRFSADHVRREWFRLSPEIVAFIAAAAQR
jgi:hypothetical protein